MLCPFLLKATHRAGLGEWMRMDPEHVLVDYGVEQARGRGNAGGATYQEPQEDEP